MSSLVRTAAYLILGLVLAEGVLRNSWRIGYIDFDLEMWRYARELKVVSKDPEIGLEHQPEKEAQLMGVRVRTDVNGFRRFDDETEKIRPPTGRNVLIVGDSATLGWGVSEGETYPALLQRALPRYRVFNTAVGNTNTPMQVHLLKSNIKKVKPDWVVLGYSVNDPEPEPDLTKSPLTKFALGFALTHLYNLVTGKNSSSYVDYYNSLYQEESEAWATWKLAATELANLGKANSFPISVLLLPELHQPFQQGPFRNSYDKVQKYLQSHGIEVIDPSVDFPPGDGSDYWVISTDPHPNAKAHKILATSLLKSRQIRD